jgi:2-methylisocitrate lyase-like PEP mutase family enzyme
MRTVHLLERSGAAGVLIEDQQSPKRCGHYDGTKIIGMAEMLAKLEAAFMARTDPDFLVFARTDARAVEGLDAAIVRGRAFAEAGADAVFVEAPRSLEELQRIPKRIPDVPLVVNIVEGGLTPELSVAELKGLGYHLIIHANLLQRVMYYAGARALTHLRLEGETQTLHDQMFGWQERQDLVGLGTFQRLEAHLKTRADPAL